jgi:methyl-accepting chemotaxis protein
MSIRFKLFLAFSILAGLACSLAFFGLRGITASGDLALRLYDGPLLAINHARSADATLHEARLFVTANPGLDVPEVTATKFQQQIAEITEDLSIVRKRIRDRRVLTNTRMRSGVDHRILI